MSNETEKEIENIESNIIEGLERTLGTLGEALPKQVDSLSQKQLRRALKATINYIYKKEESDSESLSEREQRFIGGMFTLVEAGSNYTMHILGELQRDHDSKQRAEKAKGDK